MKQFATFTLLVTVFALAIPNQSDAQVNKGRNFLGANLTFTDPIGFGAQFEAMISPNIGIGAMIRYWGQSESQSGFGYTYEWSYTIIMPQAVGYYHFMPGNELDPYAGARLGYGIHSVEVKTTGYTGSVSENSGLFLTATGGVRYFFTPKVSINGSLEFRLAGEKYFADDLSILAGVDFTL